MTGQQGAQLEMDRAEQVAKAVVEAVVPGASMQFQTIQASGEPDFFMTDANGRVAAVEVTMSADSRRLEIQEAIRDGRKGGSRVPSRRCQKGWWVLPRRTARIRRIRADVDEYLSRVEADGLSRFTLQDAARFDSVRSIFRDLQIEAGWVVNWKTPSTIRINPPGYGCMPSQQAVVNAALKEARKPDNRRKLARAGFNESHLFVYVDRQNFLPWSSLNEFPPPQVPPTIPTEIDWLWVATADETGAAFVGWLARRGEEWRDLGRIEAAVSS